LRRLGVFLVAVWFRLRLLVLASAIAAVVWVVATLPPLSGQSRNAVGSLVPSNSPALQAERISAEHFAFPVLTGTVVVVRNPRGLPAARQASLVALAARLSSVGLPGFRAIGGALPVVNSVGAPPFSREHGTTALLYLYFRPSASSVQQVTLAQRLVRRVIGHERGEFEGVTGAVPAQVAQEHKIEGTLLWVELATLLVVALVVALRFRAVGTALLTLGTVIAAYLVAERVVALLGRAGGITLPGEMGPVLIVLVMGVATDYSIFFLSRFRALMAQGQERRDAASATVRHIAPVVIAAAVTVAAGTASLLVASLAFLRDFGPGLAIAVLIAMVTVVLLVPATLAIAGSLVFWPHRPAAIAPPSPQTPSPEPGSPSSGQGASATDAAPDAPARRSPARLAARHPIVAFAVTAIVIVAGASGLRLIAVGNDLIKGLPASSEPYRAYAQAQRGFARGAIAPTLLVVSGHDLGAKRARLERLQGLLETPPGVTKVVGARQWPLPARPGVVISHDGSAARYLLFLHSDPLGSRGLAQVRALSGRLPALLRQVGLSHARPLLGGDSALSADIVDSTLTDLARVTPVMLAAIFVILALYLRALVAPAYLVLTSLLAVTAALGLTVYVMQDLLGYGQITYYVIFVTAVLLVSLGSDYNVFLIGRIWQQGRRLSLRDAVEVAGARAARPIALAGLVLAGAFALLAVVPLRAFREVAFAMTTGLLIDAFVVRAILVPALVSLFGPLSAWPRRLSGERTSAAEQAQAPRGVAAAYAWLRSRD
jgi:putative drug exporter of the RND superfamily